jgi:hypothetical protein
MNRKPDSSWGKPHHSKVIFNVPFSMFGPVHIDYQPDTLAFPGLYLNVLRELSFRTGPEAVAYLKGQTESRGFELPQRDLGDADRVRLLCHRAEYERGKRTIKIVCLAGFRLQKRSDRFSVDIADDVGHNHPLERPPPQDIPNAVEISVRDAVIMEMSVVHIIQVVERQSGHLLSYYDVEAFNRPTFAQAVLGETDSSLTQPGKHEEA